MSKLTAGEVLVTLGDDELILKPTLRAMNAVNRQYNGLRNARERLVNEDADAIVFILRHGLNLDDKAARDLPERVFRNGLTGELLVALIRYVAILGNGGKPLPDEADGRDEGEAQDQGN